MASVEKPVRRGEEPTLIFGDGKPFGFDVVGALRTSDLGAENHLSREASSEINLLRGAVRSLRGSKDKFDKEAAQGINGWFKAEMSYSDNYPALISKNVLGWLATASNGEFKDFCVWNVARNIVQQEATDKVTPRIQDDALRRVDGLIKINYFPRKAREAYGQAIAKSGSLIAFDSFETGGLGAEGAFDRYNLGVANMFDDRKNFKGVRESMLSTGFHEYTHGAGYALKAGFRPGIKRKTEKDGTFGWLEEALVTHTEAVADNTRLAQPEIIIPSKRKHDIGAYYVKERELLALSTQYGPKPISVEQMIEAYFSRRNRLSTARRDLENKFVQNFQSLFPGLGEEGFYNISERYTDLTSAKANKLLSSAISKAAQRLGIDDLIESVESDV